MIGSGKVGGMMQWGHDRIRIGWGGAWPDMNWRGGSMT